MGHLLGREGTGDRGEGLGWAVESRGQRCVYMTVSLWNSFYHKLDDKGWGGGSVSKVLADGDSLASMKKSEFSTCVCSPST